MKLLLIFVVLIGICVACDNFIKYTNMFCKYGSEDKPCVSSDARAFKAACCSMPGKCSFSEFPKDNVCCFTQECLNRCYPGKRYQLGTVY
ncbi:unnamed protein product [Caenorhabditis angaria]|uniref:WAP domain-containing protein n=1 Tax=Caenorhabditis angaria TaxID=860376 RepID=A0A9P1MZG0_9PELO|nr:unnamed protein product [Caenorhabditis angaria]